MSVCLTFDVEALTTCNSHTIHMNWLVNPTGKPDGFRAVDWVVELNNLYTKVIYGGSYSKCTLNLMIKQSPLIEIMHEVQVIVEDWLHIKACTRKYAQHDMGKLLAHLASHMASGEAHICRLGRKGNWYRIPDQAAVGMMLLATEK